MRISDWNSDVCSSDLQSPSRSDRTVIALRNAAVPARPWKSSVCRNRGPIRLKVRYSAAISLNTSSLRSEEHTSELQSLMRISYAVFCLKKKQDKHIESTKKSKDTLYTVQTHNNI